MDDIVGGGDRLFLLLISYKPSVPHIQNMYIGVNDSVPSLFPVNCQNRKNEPL